MTTPETPPGGPVESGPRLRAVPAPEPGFTSAPASGDDQQRDRAVDPLPEPPDPSEEGEAGPGRRLQLTKASAIRIRPTYWAWQDRIPRGAITLGPGREGIGKSLFCSWLAAQVTRGTLDGVHHGAPKGVVYAATEDSWEATIAPRLHAAGADLDRVYRVEVQAAGGGTLPLTLPRDCDELAAEILAADVGLLVLDPLISAVDSRVNVNQEELRTALEPLAKLADETGCAVFGLAHFNKASGTDVLSRVTGSRAFSAVARAAVAFARDPEADDGSCVLSQVKNNLGSLDLPSLRYLVEPVTLDTVDGPGQWGRLRFTGETTAHVETILNDTGQGDDGDSDDRHELDAWLRNFLADQGGSAPVKDIFNQGHAGGYSKDQLKRAKKRLRLAADKDGMRGGWTWQLPEECEGGRTPK